MRRGKRETRDYYGPAGIFSTDDAAADRQQIEAEEYEPEETESEEDFEDEELAELDLGDEHRLYAVCNHCEWWDTVYYFDGHDALESREAVETRLRREHLKSGCQKELQISE